MQPGSPAFALRTRHELYAEYSDGFRELYDLQTDPYQLQNLYDTADKGHLKQLSQRLAELSVSSGPDDANAATVIPLFQSEFGAATLATSAGQISSGSAPFAASSASLKSAWHEIHVDRFFALADEGAPIAVLGSERSERGLAEDGFLTRDAFDAALTDSVFVSLLL
jgi:hypothetical protein